MTPELTSVVKQNEQLMTLMDAGTTWLGIGLDNWQIQSSSTIALEVVIERDLDKKLSNVLHFDNSPICIPIPEEVPIYMDQEKLKEFVTLGGSLGGFSTLLIIALSYIHKCCTKKSFAKFTNTQREIYKAELLGTPEVSEETIPEISEQPEEEVIESSESSEAPYEAWIDLKMLTEERKNTVHETMLHLGQST